MRLGGMALLAAVAALAWGCCQKTVEAPAETAGKAAAPSADELADKVAAKVVEQLDRKLDEKLARLAEAKPAEKPAAESKPAEVKPAEVKPAETKAAEVIPPGPQVRPEPPRQPEPAQVPAPPRAGMNDESVPPPKVDYAALLSRYNTEAGASPCLGSDSAKVQVFIISDFQCPVCRRAADGMHWVYNEFGDKVQWIFWQNPLDMHQRALPTAQASMAAFMQGKFWEYHDLLFASQNASDAAALTGYADKLGLEAAAFARDQQSPELLKKIRSDQAASEKIGARGTPSFVINGKLQVGWGSAGGISSMVQRELEEMEKLVASGMSVKDARIKRAEANADSPEQARVYIDHFINGKVAERP
jgi:protein-disulfide isomerase